MIADNRMQYIVSILQADKTLHLKDLPSIDMGNLNSRHLMFYNNGFATNLPPTYHAIKMGFSCEMPYNRPLKKDKAKLFCKSNIL